MGFFHQSKGSRDHQLSTVNSPLRKGLEMSGCGAVFEVHLEVLIGSHKQMSHRTGWPLPLGPLGDDASNMIHRSKGLNGPEPVRFPHLPGFSSQHFPQPHDLGPPWDHSPRLLPCLESQESGKVRGGVPQKHRWRSSPSRLENLVGLWVNNPLAARQISQDQTAKDTTRNTPWNL